jgi:uncharacterized protein (TIGR00730 family)
MVLKRPVKRIFRSAKQELKHAEKKSKKSAQECSPAYQLAYLDQTFLVRKELRSVRLQLELLKPELSLNDEKIQSTIVIFGSARTPEPEIAKKRYQIIQAHLEKNPTDKTLQNGAKIAEKIAQKSFYYSEARKLGALISQGKDAEGNSYVVITGGGPGIMEAANRGAHDVEAKSIGLNIVLPLEQGPNHYITPELCFQFHYFAIRKMHFLIRAKALIVFPGGYGTLDELFEALTLMQTQKMKKMPVILVGKAYWRQLIDFDFMVEEGVVDSGDLSLFSYAENAEQAWQIIQDFYRPPTGESRNNKKISKITKKQNKMS